MTSEEVSSIERACTVCDGEFTHASECGCCGSANCAVFCGCRCPSEYWCNVCRVSHENPCEVQNDA